jgi:dTDP-4-dehydrorhamnose reductase
MEVVEARRFGLYHLSNDAACSRYELAIKAAEFAGLDPKGIIGKPDAEMGRRTPRLKYAVMAMDALKQAGFAPPRRWDEALAEYVHTLRFE